MMQLSKSNPMDLMQHNDISLPCITARMFREDLITAKKRHTDNCGGGVVWSGVVWSGVEWCGVVWWSVV